LDGRLQTSKAHAAFLAQPLGQADEDAQAATGDELQTGQVEDEPARPPAPLVEQAPLELLGRHRVEAALGGDEAGGAVGAEDDVAGHLLEDELELAEGLVGDAAAAPEVGDGLVQALEFGQAVEQLQGQGGSRHGTDTPARVAFADNLAYAGTMATGSVRRSAG